MIERVNKGEPLKISAENWNRIADVVNATDDPEANLFSSVNNLRKANGHREIIAKATVAIEKGQAVHVKQLLSPLSSSGHQLATQQNLYLEADLSFPTGFEPFGVALNSGPAGEQIRVAVDGLVVAKVDVTSASWNVSGAPLKAFLTPKAGTTIGQWAIKPINGPLHVITYNSNYAFCVIRQGSYDEDPDVSDSSTYWVDVDGGNYGRWDPWHGEPSGWNQYTRVGVVLHTIGWDASGHLMSWPIKLSWSCVNAPKIVLGAGETLGEECDSEQESDSQ